MRVDGREIAVSGKLLPPWNRRTNALIRLALSAAFLALIIISSMVTRNDWEALEKSISGIVGVLTPTSRTWCTSPTASPSWRCRSSS